MRRQQQGMTAIGFVIFACFAGLFVFAGLRLTPIYLEQMKIASTLMDVKADLDGTKTTVSQIRTAINKRLDIEMVRGMDARDFKISTIDSGFLVEANYERRSRYIANLYLLVVFERSVEIRR